MAGHQNDINSFPFHELLDPSGKLWASFYRVDNRYLLRFTGFADFTISSDGLEIIANPVQGVSEQTVEHLYLNVALPLAFSRQLKLVLHASAVEMDNTAVAFLGVSGRGKSTLAASFSTSGFRFLTDDGLQLEPGAGGYLILPSHPSIRLWDDSLQALIPESTPLAAAVDYTPKARLLAGDEVAYCNQPRPLSCAYFLGEGQVDSVMITPVSGRDAMIELVKHSFLLDIEAREMLTHHFGQLLSLARTPIFFRLDYPRDYEILPEVREAVRQHMLLVGLQ